LKLFSERKELKKSRTEIQKDFMDDSLRNRLWNLLILFYWSDMNEPKYTIERKNIETFIIRMWNNYFKRPLDTMPKDSSDLYKEIRKYFFECSWFEVYDFLEFVFNNYPDKSINEEFKDACNSILEEELSAYRFIGNRIIEITSEEEISEIEQALETPFEPIKVHLKNALEKISDKKSPDYRNSIKESISAVEAICRIITGEEKDTLGKALDVIEQEGKIELHPALKRAFDSLYGYTSSAEGIRHSLLDKKLSLGLEDAKFMLVSCSAFINYLIAKANKANILNN